MDDILSMLEHARCSMEHLVHAVLPVLPVEPHCASSVHSGAVRDAFTDPLLTILLTIAFLVVTTVAKLLWNERCKNAQFREEVRNVLGDGDDVRDMLERHNDEAQVRQAIVEIVHLVRPARTISSRFGLFGLDCEIILLVFYLLANHHLMARVTVVPLKF